MIGKKKIGIICGGPSLERGISLNSARSLADHLDESKYEIHPFYVDQKKNFYKLAQGQLYSNTPADFDFKLRKTHEPLESETLIQALRSLNIVFPAIHGQFGETGELQSFLQYNNIPFVGCCAYTCQNMFFKNLASKIQKEHGFETLPCCYLDPDAPTHITEALVHMFFESQKLSRAIVKPSAGGSSIGVFSVTNYQQACNKLQELFKMTERKQNLILEPFCAGREFNIVVLESKSGAPVSLVPTEVQICYKNNQIFDYRRKYLPTNNTAWPTPGNFSPATLSVIRNLAERLFKVFHMRHFARLDGWVLNDGRVIFTDLNPISGMEQNSFLFLQASRCGMTHKDVLNHIVETALCA